ncbi:hypothetical protein LCGC14_1079900 [marine sediment metagenome]|uniref:Uncharacterized protein n=1 Tax=marine sediment metagenome TaxID=412755 RepID=A0A0F9QLD6_9ZZZZ
MDELDRIIEDLQSHVDFLGELVKRLEKIVAGSTPASPNKTVNEMVSERELAAEMLENYDAVKEWFANLSNERRYELIGTDHYKYRWSTLPVKLQDELYAIWRKEQGKIVERLEKVVKE